jgi:hypothetical protein
LELELTRFHGHPILTEEDITRPALANERVRCNAAGQVELKLKAPNAKLRAEVAIRDDGSPARYVHSGRRG